MEKGGTKMGKDWWKTRALILLILGTILVSFYYYHAYIGNSYHRLRSLWDPDLCRVSNVVRDRPLEGVTKSYQDIMLNRTISRHQITPGPKNAFFIESSCATSCTPPLPGGLRFNSRQACAVYSFASLNPDYQVYIFHTCPLIKNYYEKSNQAVQEMLNMNNVMMVEGGCGSDLAAWLEDGPLMGITKLITKSAYPVEHLSDALRLLLLWKFGGTYLDLDTVTIKRNWSRLGEDWASAEDPTTVSNGILNVAKEGIGHLIFGLTLKQFRDRYNGQGWSDNGPILLTRIIREVCNLSEKKELQTLGKIQGCGFTIHDQNHFYPIWYQNWRWYFEEQKEGSESWRAEIKESFAVHIWNKLSKGTPVNVGSRQPYGLLAAQFCGPVYYASRPTF